MSELSENELNLLKTFRKRVDDVLNEEQRKNDVFLVRWLKAREWDLGKAETMFRNSVEWRKQNDMDDILDWNAPEVLRLFYPVGHVGYCDDGCPILIVPFGRSDVQGLIESTSKDIFIRYTYKILEECVHRMERQSLILGKLVTQMVVIFDLKGLSLKHLTYRGAIDVLLNIIKHFDLNYPEILKGAFAINAPTVFTVLFGLIKPLLTAHTLKKVTIFGYNDRKWKEAILQVIPVAQLPKHWGGTREENDEFCSSLVCMGGTVPPKYLNAQLNKLPPPDIKISNNEILIQDNQ